MNEVSLMGNIFLISEIAIFAVEKSVKTLQNS